MHAAQDYVYPPGTDYEYDFYLNGHYEHYGWNQVQVNGVNYLSLCAKADTPYSQTHSGNYKTRYDFMS